MTDPAFLQSLPRGDLARRLTVTSALVIAYWALAFVPLPGVDLGGLASSLSERPSLRAFGLTPFVSAFLVVELVAVALPDLRLRRNGSHAQRAGLVRAAWILGVAFATVQAWGWTTYLRSAVNAFGGPAFDGGVLDTLVLGLTLVAGSALAALLAIGISRRGVGNGFAVLLAAQLLARTPAVLRAFGDSGGTLLSAVLLVALIVGVPFALRGRPGPGPRVPVPTSGLTPLVHASSLVLLPAAVVPYLAPEAWSTLRDLQEYQAPARAVLTIALAVAFSAWFAARPRVAAAWEAARLGDPDPEAVDSAWRRARRSSLLLVCGLAALPFLANEVHLNLGPTALVGLFTAVATILDLSAELRVRARHGPLVSAYPFQRVYAAEAALAALSEAGIPAVARARNYRALTQFFEPQAPVEILVPPDRALRAAAICARVALPEAPERADPPDVEEVFG